MHLREASEAALPRTRRSSKRATQRDAVLLKTFQAISFRHASTFKRLVLLVGIAARCHRRETPVHGFPGCSFCRLLLILLLSAGLHADPVPIRHPQGSGHGFVVLKTLEGTRIAIGDMTQIVHDNRVTSRLVFHFLDGSIDDDTTVFTQRGTFRLITDHHIQRGPSFPKASDVLINALTEQITSHT
jgi:hypothetical protein